MRYFDLKLLARATTFVLGAVGVMGAATLGGCPDTKKQFDEFVDNSAPFRFTPHAGECVEPVDLSDSYLLGASVVVDPTKPLRFKLDLTVDVAGKTIDADLQAVAVAPNNGETPVGTLVGAVFTANAELDDTGAFVLDFGTIDVPMEANPILAAGVTAELKLEGCTATATDACGIVTGQITKPVPIPLDGSTWALNVIEAGDEIGSMEIVTGCPQ